MTPTLRSFCKFDVSAVRDRGQASGARRGRHNRTVIALSVLDHANERGPRMTISRRQFGQSIAAMMYASGLRAQTPPANPWGGPVVDCHFHLRPSLEGNV